MSFNDFFIVPAPDNTVSPPTGSSFLNSLLSSSYVYPLSSPLCRSFNENGIANQSRRANFLVSSSFSSGSCVNIPDTKSVSLRIWFRSVSYYSGERVTLYAKHGPYNTYYNGDSNGANSKSGYEMSFVYGYNGVGGYPYNALTFVAGGYRANMTETAIYTQNLNPYVTNIPPWIGLRMDIIPVKVDKKINGVIQSSLLKDVIKLYTASSYDVNNWSLVNTTEIFTFDSRFVPWGNYTALSNGQSYAGLPVLTSSYGFSVRQNGDANSKVFIDDFQMHVINAF